MQREGRRVLRAAFAVRSEPGKVRYIAGSLISRGLRHRLEDCLHQALAHNGSDGPH